MITSYKDQLYPMRCSTKSGISAKAEYLTEIARASKGMPACFNTPAIARVSKLMRHNEKPPKSEFSWMASNNDSVSTSL